MPQKKSEHLETYVLEVITGRRKERSAAVLRWLLKQLSRLFATVVQLRVWLYKNRIFRPHTLGCQVISIGNLTVGGTGKTPIVEIFARSLQQSGRKVAILSRGYKRREPTLSEKLMNKRPDDRHAFDPLVVSDGKRLLLDSAMSGDEPYMLASNLPDVAVLVDKNRVKAGRFAIKRLGCDTLILDDGFQYLTMRHRQDIVLVDHTNPFGGGYVLPRGLLREPIKNIRRANFIFITKSQGENRDELRNQLRRLNPTAEIAECRHEPQYLQNAYSGEKKPLEFLQGMRVAALSGIAVPEGFEDSLENLGATVVLRDRYADHHRYSQQEVISLINKSLAADAQVIITTEKDAVRLPHIERRDLPVYFLRVQIKLLSGAENFHDYIKRICIQ